MAITPYPPSPHLVANPYCVYYRQPCKNLIRQTLLEQRVWWREEQAGWIQNYLEIPPEYGEPLLAVMLCAVGDEEEYEDSTMWMGGQNEAGEWVKLTDLLGKDEGHVYRCRESAYKLRDAVEWRAIARAGGTLPENLPWPPQIALPDLLGWAINNGVSLTESGQFAWASACQSSSTSPSELNCPSPANWGRMNQWLRSVREKWSRKDKWTLKKIYQAYSKLEEMEGKYGRIPPLCDALLARLNKIRYECDWTPELGARLRAALEKMGYALDDNPTATQDTPEITKPLVAVAPAKKTKGFAEQIGVSDWNEIELSILATRIKYRKAGTDDTFIEKSWGNIGLKGKIQVYGLLINVAKHNGCFPNSKKERKRIDQTHDLNMVFKSAFGLPDNPFSNHRRMGTQSRFGSITWGGN